MGWGQAFTERLGRGHVAPIYIVEAVELGDFGETFSAASHSGFDMEASLLPDTVAITGSIVAPQTWQSSLGTFSFGLGRGSQAIKKLARGQLLQLRVGFEGLDVAEFEPVALGVVKGYDRSGHRPDWRIRCDDAMAILQTRRETDPNSAQMFRRVGVEKAIDETLFLLGQTQLRLTGTDLSDFELEPGETGAALVDPGGGAPFLIGYTGTSGGNTLTGIQANALLGTTRIAAAKGDKVYSAARLRGDPSNIYRRVLTSTGTGSNGPFDVYPKSWGFGIPQSVIDDGDIQEWRDILNGGLVVGTQLWDLVATDPVPSGLAFLLGPLQTVGAFPIMRQGQITLRCAQNLLEDHTAPFTTGITITDEDIALVERWDAYDPQVTKEFGRVRALSGSSAEDVTVEVPGIPGLKVTIPGSVEITTTVDDDLGTMPALQEATIDMSTFVYDNEATVRSTTLDRLRGWYQRVPEKIRIRCAGLRLAGLCPGDLVDISTRFQGGRNQGGDSTYSGQQAMITSVNPNYAAHSVSLTASILPLFDGIVP